MFKRERKTEKGKEKGKDKRKLSLNQDRDKTEPLTDRRNIRGRSILGHGHSDDAFDRPGELRVVVNLLSPFRAVEEDGHVVGDLVGIHCLVGGRRRRRAADDRRRRGGRGGGGRGRSSRAGATALVVVATAWSERRLEAHDEGGDVCGLSMAFCYVVSFASTQRTIGSGTAWGEIDGTQQLSKWENYN